MNRLFRIILLLLLLSAISCREKAPHVMPEPLQNKGVQPMDEFNEPLVLLLYPDQKRADSIKQQTGIENFYARSDENSIHYQELRNILEASEIKVVSGEKLRYRFISDNGAITETDLSRIGSPWQVIIFNGTDSPVLVSPDKAAGKLKELFPDFKTDKQTIRAKKPKKSNTSAPTPSHQENERDDSGAVANLPAQKETIIRLIIPAGQQAPADRDETSGIHVINSYISPHHRFWLMFDNDIFSNTDRYYTNGVVIGYSAPGMVNLPVNRLMLSLRRNSVVHASISLHHAMFTPFTTKTPPILIDDRPYASSLFLRYSQTSDDALSGIRVTSSIDAGVIGDAALGRYFQKSVHATVPTNDEPMGWETQIRNDLVLNYSVNLQKQLLKNKNAEIYAHGEATLGTLQTRAGMGINAIAGLFIPGITRLPMDYSELQQVQRDWQYGIRGGLEFRLIGYDATLQGGVFNNDNIYALKPEEIERMVAAMHLGIFARYRKLGISISQYYLSPEFKEGKQHFWGQIGLEYGW